MHASAARGKYGPATYASVVLIPAGENHWHGAPGSTPMAHIAITQKGSQTTQTEP